MLYAVSDGDLRVLSVEFDGRRVWSFREADRALPDGLAEPAGDGVRWRFEPWPDAMLAHLTGTATVGLAVQSRELSVPSQEPVLATEFSPDGRPGRMDLTDSHGRPLVVNKWGRLGRALADAPEGMLDRMLDSMDRVRDVLRAELGDRVFVTGGTLLGPVREAGELLPHDDDADLAYLSRASYPVDVAVEGMQLARALRSAGHDVLRLSAAHLQVLVEHDGMPDHYVDVFTGFLLDGYWYQHFALRTRAEPEAVLPPRTLEVRGRTEPAPRDPERVLVELYGENWRVPDPAYTFDIPAGTADRFYGWFADYNAEREDWDLHVRSTGGRRPAAGPSGLAEWVQHRTPRHRAVLELGCGTGDDAWYWAAAGRDVLALDYSRVAISAARARRVEAAGTLDLRVLNLLDLRAVVRLAAELAARPGSWTVVGRQVLNALEDRGRDNVWRLCNLLLRPDGDAHFDLVEGAEHPAIPAHRRVGLEMVVAEAHRHSLELVESVPAREVVRWFGPGDERMVTLWRSTFRRRRR